MSSLKIPEHRITLGRAIFLVSIAIIFDALQLLPKILILVGATLELIPIIGTIIGTGGIAIGFATEVILPSFISVSGYFSIWLIFQMNRVSVFSGRHMTQKSLTMLLTAAAEIIPIISALPGITLWTFTNIRVTRKEDNEARDKIRKQIRAAQEERIRAMQAAAALENP